MDAGHLIARHGEHAERVVVAQVLLHGEGELREVGEVPQIVGMHARGVEGRPVMRDIGVGVAERPAQAVQLQSRDLVPAGDLDRVEVGGVRAEVAHRDAS
jgi:hypothetical protein